MTRTPPKTYHVKSFGCQMNVYDGERMSELLGAQGMTQTAHESEAELVVFNTSLTNAEADSIAATLVSHWAIPAITDQLVLDGDSITAHANHLVDRLLIVRLAVVVRGADAFDVADQALVAAHAAMLADPNLGGLAIAVREIDCEWEFDDADAGAVALPARYEIRYRTHAIDLTQTG